MVTSREALEHLLACVDAIYAVLGEAAPTFSNDAYVVRSFETARAMGEVALALRDHLDVTTTAPFDRVVDVLREAVDGDAEGAMALFCFAVVVGPRLLVSLRDMREEVALDETAQSLTAVASATLVAEILAVGEVARQGAPMEDEAWQERARGLTVTLEEAGYAESLGISR